jgi:uncharacterized protein YjbI with pentapeptide repeats
VHRVFLFSVHAPNADFTGANLAGAILAKSEMRQAVFEKASLAGSDFSGCSLAETLWVKALACDVKFDRSQLTYADFSYCQRERTSFREADLMGSDLHAIIENETEWSGARSLVQLTVATVRAFSARALQSDPGRRS